MRCKTFLIFVLAVFALMLPIHSHSSMGGGKMLRPGSQAPDFKFTDLAGAKDSLYSMAKGRPTLLVFIQTACGSCQREMQFLKEVRAKESGFNILAIFIDVKEMDFKGYAKNFDNSFRFAWDEGFAVAESYGVSFAPASFLVSKDGVIEKVYRGWSKGGEEILQDIKAVYGK